MSSIRLAWVAGVTCVTIGCSALLGGDFNGLSHRCDGPDPSRACGGAGGGVSGDASTDDGGRGLRDARSPSSPEAGKGAFGMPDKDAAGPRKDTDSSVNTGGGRDGRADATRGDVDAAVLPPLDDPRVQGTTWGPAGPSPTAVIPICFTTSPHREWDGTVSCAAQTEGSDCSGIVFDSHAQVRAALESLLRETWERSARLTFTLFTSCGSDAITHILESRTVSDLVTVSFVNDGPSVATTGVGKRRFAADVHVNWRALVSRDHAGTREILRAFGHVLGFPYEWLRKDQPPTGVCPSGVEPGDDGATLPAPPVADATSVMDRCADVAAAPPFLSPGDVIGVQYTYGLKHNDALVGTRGRCIAIPSTASAGVGPLSGESCTAEGGLQSWFRVGPGLQPANAFETLFPQGLLCIAVQRKPDGGGATTIASEKCSNSETQRIPVANVEWRAMGSMCLEAVGDHVELGACNGTPAQRWNFFNDDTTIALNWQQIQSSDGRCVSTQTQPVHWDAARATGEALALVPCNQNDARQLFFPLGSGFISIGAPQLCLQLSSERLDPGSRLILGNACLIREASSSEFYVSGRLHALGKCIAMDGGGLLFTEDCDEGASRQIWDYHF